MSSTELFTPQKAPTGIAGLDEILEGGLPQGYTYLIQGDSGTGKTTLGLQFVLAGAEAGETVLYITLSETKQELQEIAASHGWSLEGVHIHDLRLETAAQLQSEQTIFRSADVELGEAMENILQTIGDFEPQRAVFDSLTEIHLLAETPLRYRRQMLALRETLTGIDCTALITNSELDGKDRTIHSLVHGVIELEKRLADYGVEKRRLRVEKMRGMPYHGGYHNFKIISGGLEVHPRPRLEESAPEPTWTLISSGIEEMDELVGQGLHSGTACLVAGQTGTGKSALATEYMAAAAGRGERSVAFIFDESVRTFFKRSESIGCDLRQFEQEGLIEVRQIEAGAISPGEFAQMIRQSITTQETRIVLIDSLNGYLNAMPHKRVLLIHMHELLAYLSREDILTLLTITHHGVAEPVANRDIDLSYLADTVLLLRHFEARGQVRKAISVLKKRHGPHERTIREMEISGKGITVGDPLVAFSGVLSGRPRYDGKPDKLLAENSDKSG